MHQLTTLNVHLDIYAIYGLFIKHLNKELVAPHFYFLAPHF